MGTPATGRTSSSRVSKRAVHAEQESCPCVPRAGTRLSPAPVHIVVLLPFWGNVFPQTYLPANICTFFLCLQTGRPPVST